MSPAALKFYFIFLRIDAYTDKITHKIESGRCSVDLVFDQRPQPLIFLLYLYQIQNDSHDVGHVFVTEIEEKLAPQPLQDYTFLESLSMQF